MGTLGGHNTVLKFSVRVKIVIDSYFLNTKLVALVCIS